MSLNNVAVIPARAGSKRIYNKNIKNFLGKPVITYSIEIAISTKLFDKVIVSTDSEEIAEISIKYGAEVPFKRPKDLADDFTGTHDVIGHAAKFLEKKYNKVDYICCIYPTAPLISKKDLIKGYNLINTKKWDSVIAATNYSYPIYRSFKKLSTGGLQMIFPEHYNSRSQDLEFIYHDAGQFYWAEPKIWKAPPKSFNSKNSIVEIPNYRAQDIDTIDDWKKAEFIYQLLAKSESSLYNI